MTQTTTPLPPVREKLEQIQAKAVADGRISAADAGNGAGAALPSFSKGTVPLDDTGKPIIGRGTPDRAPGEFTEGATIPPVTEGSAVTPPGAAAVVPPAQAASAPAGVAPAEAAAGAAAAETAAAALADEYEDVSIRDLDLDADVSIRVPKQYAGVVKRGYDKRTSYDRKMSFLANAEPVLKELILDGRINALLPVIDAALKNEAFGKYVTDAFRRVERGDPLEAAVREIQAAPPAAALPQEPQFVDPFVDPRIQTLEDRVAANDRAMTEWRDAQTRAQQTQQQQQEQVRRNTTLMAGAHQDLASAYPGVFDTRLGSEDPAWKAAYKYAQDSGYLQRYDLRAAIVFGGQGWRQMEADRLQATQSPAAAAIAATETRLLDTATREAAAAARTVSGGAAAQSTMPAPPPKPVPTYAPGQAPLDPTTGKPRDIKPREEFMAEMLAWQEQYGRLKQA